MRKKCLFFICIVLFILAVSCKAKEPIEIDGPETIRKHIEEAFKKNVDPENMPFLIEGNGKKGILLMHGLTATPWELRELALYLGKRNITVYVPLLDGHGTKIDDLENIKDQEWIATAEESYLALNDIVDEAYVGGVSMGSALALLLSAKYKPKGIVAISTPVWLKDKRAKFAFIGKYFIPYVDHKVEPGEERYYYTSIPVSSVEELMKLTTLMKRIIRTVDEPILIIQPINDKTVEPRSGQFIYDHISSEEKTLKLINTSHVAVQYEKKIVLFQEIADFIEKD